MRAEISNHFHLLLRSQLGACYVAADHKPYIDFEEPSNVSSHLVKGTLGPHNRAPSDRLLFALQHKIEHPKNCCHRSIAEILRTFLAASRGVLGGDDDGRIASPYYVSIQSKNTIDTTSRPK